MNDVRPCRSVAEAHLFLDLLGAPRESRQQRLVAEGNDLVSVYTVLVDGQEAEFRFLVPDDPLGSDDFGGPEPSKLIDPGQWLLHADRDRSPGCVLRPAVQLFE